MERMMSYSLDLRERAIALLNTGYSLRAVAELLGVHNRTVSHWKKRAAEGRLPPAYPRKRGAYRINDEALEAHLKSHPDAYLQELAAVAGGTAQGIRDALKRLGISRKKRPHATKSATRRRGQATLSK
jgi:excisionase family DNA binding protein